MPDANENAASDSASAGRRSSVERFGRFMRRALPILILVGLLVGAYLYFPKFAAEPEPEIAPIRQEPIPVSVTTVAPETVPVPMRFLGQTEAKSTVEVRARVAGYLQEWTFAEGTQVEMGEKLFQIDPRPFQVQLELFQRLRSGGGWGNAPDLPATTGALPQPPAVTPSTRYTSPENALAQTRAGLASAEATLARTEQQLRRFQALRGTGAVTAEEVEEWHTQQDVALADVQLRKAEIAAAQLNLDYSSIESPITGMIGESLKGIGSYVDAGPNGLLAVIQETDPIYVRYSVTELEMLAIPRRRAGRQHRGPLA